MFWGLIMEPGRCYTQTVKVSFHVSMAAMDISTSSDEPAQVMCVFEGRNYLLCTLNKKDQVQCSLDLNFEAGSKVSFATNGKSHVHLTGYLTTFEDEEGEEEEEAGAEEENENPKEKKRPVRKAALAATEGPSPKKAKKNNLLEVEEEEDSDSDFDIEKHLETDKVAEETSESEVESDAEEVEGGDEEAEAEEEEDEDEEASSLSEEEASSLSEEEESSLSEKEESEEEETTETKPKQNGIVKPNATPKQKNKQEKKPKKQENKQQKPLQKKAILKDGVTILDLKEGSGQAAKTGKVVHVFYEGRLKEGNKLFDSTTKGPGFKFRVGRGEVIKGWDIGLVGMKAGGKRRIICPPQTAYGTKGSPPVIPPNATLVFEVELKKIS